MAAQAGGGGGEPSEEELRAAYEAELARVTSTDMLGQAAVSLLNIGARRLGAPSEGDPAAAAPAAGAGRDLEQVRDAIDGARALLEILERRISPQELGPLKDALSRLQMAYAREVQLEPAQPGQPAATGAGEPASHTQQPGAAAGNQPQKPADGPGGPGPGPAESSGRLWVPGR